MQTEDYVTKRRSEIAHNLRQLRRHHGWSQERMAVYLDCSRRRINRVEQARVELGVGELELLAKAFEVPLARILEVGVERREI